MGRNPPVMGGDAVDDEYEDGDAVDDVPDSPVIMMAGDDPSVAASDCAMEMASAAVSCVMGWPTPRRRAFSSKKAICMFIVYSGEYRRCALSTCNSGFR